jgi:DeoR/GlpR family transcriptional regulator of sugar metabolism
VFAIERRQKINSIIEKTNSITVSELSQRLQVSVVTIRKDLDILESEGLVTRTFGGVILGQNSAPEDTADRLIIPSPLVVEAAKFIAPGQTIMLGRGKNVVELAEYLRIYENLTVITNSMEVALKLLKAPHIDVILTGGILRARTMTMLGHLAERVIKEICFDVSFSEADGIHPTYGITSSNIVEASTEAALLKSSNHPIILAEASVIGKIAPTLVSKLKPNLTTIVEGRPDPVMAQQLEKSGLKLIITESST